MSRRRAAADPAPSKWRYRMQRLWLTPLFRRILHTGIPAAALIASTAWYVSDPARTEPIVDAWTGSIRAIQDRPEFTVSLLQIEGASEQLQADIEEALPIDLPLSQFNLDMDGLREMLEGLDPVADAQVQIKAGGILSLRITERQPAIAWMSEDGIDVLDATGHRVATLSDIAAAGTLPLMAGTGAERAVPEALRLIETAAPVAERVVGLTRVGNRRWDLVLKDGPRVMLPEDSPAAALDRVLAMHTAKDVLNRDVAAVDLRLPDRPVLRLSGVARGQLRRLQDAERSQYEEDR
ncbi:MAG: cell division protein FtsQ/DivIB [Pseudomonadota bacterium]